MAKNNTITDWNANTFTMTATKLTDDEFSEAFSVERRTRSVKRADLGKAIRRARRTGNEQEIPLTTGDYTGPVAVRLDATVTAVHSVAIGCKYFVGDSALALIKWATARVTKKSSTKAKKASKKSTKKATPRLRKAA